MADGDRVELHLRVRVKPGALAEFLAFVREATPFYESPGGIRVRLMRSLEDDHRFIELIEYADSEAYERHQVRAAKDPEMLAFLRRWRALLAEDPVVEAYRPARA